MKITKQNLIFNASVSVGLTLSKWIFDSITAKPVSAPELITYFIFIFIIFTILHGIFNAIWPNRHS